jgi:hypothetical protein
MPLSKYFGGHGEKVMKDMKKKHGDKEGKSIFYATSNKNKKKRDKKGIDTGPSDKVKKKFNFN